MWGCWLWKKKTPSPAPSPFTLSSLWVWSRRDGARLLAFGFGNRWPPPSSARPVPSGTTLPHTPVNVPSSPGRSAPSEHIRPYFCFSASLGTPFVLLVCVSVFYLFFFFWLGFLWQPFLVSWPREVNWSLGPPLRCGPHLTLASRGYFYPGRGDAVEILAQCPVTRILENQRT